ncbi:MAG: alpha/beta hydrolase [Cyclobacteriaceae bacterium]
MQYKKPWYLINSHFETIIPYLNYEIYQIPYERERLELEDGDFLDLDWVKSKNDQLIVISHAFEGNSRDYFIERFAKYFSERNYDILIWNFRSCSKELNRLPHIYSFNDLSDLNAVLKYATSSNKYRSVFLAGFSMGAVTTLNYLSSQLHNDGIKAAVAISVPLELPETLKRLGSGMHGLLYGRSFHDKLKRKLIRKAKQHPDTWDLKVIEASHQLEDLIEIIKHSHKLENDYLEKISPIHQIEQIKNPTLIINAKNDPLLGPSSYPDQINDKIDLCYPNRGGHVGFSSKGKDYSWIELKSEVFLSQFLE